MKLYHSSGTCSLAVLIALNEAGVSFDTVTVSLASHTTADGADYYAISPRGYVPLLEFDDGSRHTEGAALLQYVADLDPTHALIGAPGSSRRLAVLEWLAFIGTELHKVFSPWLWSKEMADSTRQFARDKLALRFKELDALLAAQPFLAGEFSVADAYAFAIIGWTRFLAITLAPYPNLEAFLERVAQRPHVQRALKG